MKSPRTFPRPAASKLALLAVAALGAVGFSAAAGSAGRAPASRAQAPAIHDDWRDPSPHTVRRVNTGLNVDVEVVDWGGTGPPLIFLAGFGNTAHVWDDFAPRFTHGFHVIGITRRGFGGSSKPEGGYDSETLANDILAVMDQMRFERALFVAHSFGGSELNWLAAHLPRRVIRAVYLDAAFDFAQLYATPEWTAGPFPRPRFPAGDPNTPASMTAWLSVFAGPGYPESEVRAMFEVDATGHLAGQRIAAGVEAKLRAGAEPASLLRIIPPSLAIYGTPRTVREKYPWYDQMSADEQRAAEARFQVERRIYEQQQSRFRLARAAGISEVAGGRHYVFLTNPEVVETRVRRFLQSSLRGGHSSPRVSSYGYPVN